MYQRLPLLSGVNLHNQTPRFQQTHIHHFISDRTLSDLTLFKPKLQLTLITKQNLLLMDLTTWPSHNRVMRTHYPVCEKKR
jgi:hypothetical protein